MLRATEQLLLTVPPTPQNPVGLTEQQAQPSLSHHVPSPRRVPTPRPQKALPSPSHPRSPPTLSPPLTCDPLAEPLPRPVLPRVALSQPLAAP